MKPFVTTLTMALMAGIAGAIAWHYFPKNEVADTNARIGQPLLEEDATYDTSDVFRIGIERYNREQDLPTKMDLARVSGSWVIPGKGDFLASNAERISGVIDSLRDKKILGMPSDQQNDHEEYGVVEFAEAGASRAGVGTLLTLEDSRRNQLAQIIIGNPTDDPAQRFVRFPGQPQIYVIEFDKSLLTTDFTDWVDGDLLRFGNQQAQLQQMLESIEINYYFRDPRNPDKGKTHVYKARIYPAAGQWVYDLWPASEDQQLEEQPSIRSAPVNVGVFRDMLGLIFSSPLRDVQRKSPEAAQDLADPAESNPVTHFDWLKTRGYEHSGFADSQHQFESLAGNIRLRYRNGNVDTLAIGDLAGLDMQDRSNINRFLLVTCGLDESVIPEPEKPADDDDDAQREYQKLLSDRNEMLELSRGRFRSLNQVHADWLYVIPQDSVSSLFPSMSALAVDAERP